MANLLLVIIFVFIRHVHQKRHMNTNEPRLPASQPSKGFIFLLALKHVLQPPASLVAARRISMFLAMVADHFNNPVDLNGANGARARDTRLSAGRAANDPSPGATG